MKLASQEGGSIALAGVAQWIELWPVNRKAAISIPSQGTCLGCSPDPQVEAFERQPIVSLTHPCFSPSLPLFLKINKILKKKKKEEAFMFLYQKCNLWICKELLIKQIFDKYQFSTIFFNSHISKIPDYRTGKLKEPASKYSLDVYPESPFCLTKLCQNLSKV